MEYISFPDRVIATDTLGYWGYSRIADPAPTNSPENAPVYRFFNVRHNAFFYTASETEKDLVVRNSSDSNRDNVHWPYVFQGAQFKPAASYSGAVDLYRFYNYRTGHHFFTASESEREFVLEKIATELDWQNTLADASLREDIPFRRKQDDRDFLVKQRCTAFTVPHSTDTFLHPAILN